MNPKFTPNHITHLNDNEIFVFGSNLAGLHHGGAAKVAVQKFGAIMGQGEGLQGNSYAIPTIQGGADTIKPYVDSFIDFAKNHRNLHFYVTKIGCGIAGFKEEEIAPLFTQALLVDNISLPQSFFQIIISQPYVWRMVIVDGVKTFVPKILLWGEPNVGTSYDSNLTPYDLLSIDFHVNGFLRFMDPIGEIYFTCLEKSSSLLRLAVKMASVDFEHVWCVDYGEYIVAKEIQREMEDRYNSNAVQEFVKLHPDLAEQNPDRNMLPVL